MSDVIRNKEELIRNGMSNPARRARRLALEILEAGLEAADPRKAVERAVFLRGEDLIVADEVFNLKDVERIYVVGAGKATGAMAEEIEKILGDTISGGHVNVLRGTRDMFNLRNIGVTEAGHPIPDNNGVRGAKKILQLVREVGRYDLVLVLISGGASTLMALPQKGLSLEDKQRATEMMLKSGASIDEVNVVRKHLSGIKGGQLARVIYPARCIGLLLSDVVGDDMSIIGSGPTVPDESTYSDALKVLKRYSLVEALSNIVAHLEKGIRGEIPETPKPGDKVFISTENFIIGNNEMALKEMINRAGELGLGARVLNTQMTGEARKAGHKFAKQMNKLHAKSESDLVLLQGGETTVAVKGRGKGGRNQEFVLGALLNLGKWKGVAVASIGTDGIDGDSDAAGAIVDIDTLRRGNDMGLDIEMYLERNDSNTYLSLLNECIITGPTGTNVNDIVVGVAVD